MCVARFREARADRLVRILFAVRSTQPVTRDGARRDALSPKTRLYPKHQPPMSGRPSDKTLGLIAGTNSGGLLTKSGGYHHFLLSGGPRNATCHLHSWNRQQAAQGNSAAHLGKRPRSR